MLLCRNLPTTRAAYSYPFFFLCSFCFLLKCALYVLTFIVFVCVCYVTLRLPGVYLTMQNQKKKLYTWGLGSKHFLVNLSRPIIMQIKGEWDRGNQENKTTKDFFPLLLYWGKKLEIFVPMRLAGYTVYKCINET